jgi:hypothetical protein
MRRLFLSLLVVTLLIVALHAALQIEAHDPDNQRLAAREEHAELSNQDAASFNFPTAGSGIATDGLPTPAAPETDRQASESSRRAGPREGSVGAVPADYAPTDRWRKTAMPCWGLRGTAPEDFVVEVDSSTHTVGESSALLASLRETAGWGTLYQFASASHLRGKRLEFSADVRTADVQLGANLFVRADDASGNAVAMDNMWFSYAEDHGKNHLVHRHLVGSNDWTTHRIVLDIPAEAAVISYGVALDGPGRVWIDNAQLEPVTPDTAITAIPRPAHLLQSTGTFTPINLLPTPRNLHFEREGSGFGCD